MQLLSAKAVAARLDVSRAHVYRLMREFDFPAPLRVGGKLAWVETEVIDWIAARAEAR